MAHHLIAPDVSTISSNLANRTTWKIESSLPSDHLGIIMDINTKSNFPLEHGKNTFTSYRKANWDKFTQDIELSLQDVKRTDNVHTANKTLIDLKILADKHHIPKGSMKNLSQLLPQHIKDLILEQNILRSKNHLDPKIISPIKEITKIIGENRTNKWNSKLDQIGYNKNKSHLPKWQENILTTKCSDHLQWETIDSTSSESHSL